MQFSNSSRMVCLSLALLKALTAATPAPRVSAQAAARFLEQASWGPTPATIARVQSIGFSTYIDEQFAKTPSTISDLIADAKGNYSIRPAQEQFFENASRGDDQLRQRTVFALGQVWVVSAVKLKAQAIPPYLRLLQKNAFGNFSTLMSDVTLSPAMGHYLDMVDNDKPNPKSGKGANENYAREVMQLFTLGLYTLNGDGSVKKDSARNPISTYDQDQIEGFARAFTGWTYAPIPGAVSHFRNPENWTAPMVAIEAHHDTDSKLVLSGKTLPAQQSAEVDLQQALDNIFQHPNTGPFICRQLIQHLVTSNPSAAYVARVATVFSGGANPRGDLKAVIKAVLLDPEARKGDSGTIAVGEGHLREPALFIAGLIRALNGQVATINSLTDYSNIMGQNMYLPPTVFNYFLPAYDIGGTTINAPEFQILSSSTAMRRVDFVNSLVYGKIAGLTIDLKTFGGVTSGAVPTSESLLKLVNDALMRGAMSKEMHDTIITAMDAATTPLAKLETAVYLAAASSEYQVER